MFNPKYVLTIELLQNINEIERLYGRLETLRAPRELMLNLERDNLITSTYASNKIEGNPLTKIEVSNLLLGERIPTNRNEKEVTNYFNILNNLNKYIDKQIDFSLMLNFHNELMDGIDDNIKGKIREQEVVVGKYDNDGKLIIKHNPPFHTKQTIDIAINQLFRWINNNKNTVNIIKIGVFHHQFEYIHPFVDGNGRIGRILTALLFLKYKYAINKYFILDDYYDIDKNEYSDKLHSADTGNDTEWLIYFTQGIIYSMQSALGKINEGLSKLSISIRPTPKEKAVIDLMNSYKEVTTQNIVDEMRISRQQAFNLLKSLVEKGLIEQKGSSKNTYYVLL